MSEPQPAATPPATPAAKNQRTLVGRVVSDRMQKTVTVLIERRVKDTLMGKTLTRSRKYHAHVPSGEYKNGDLVEIAECRPISKTKSWTVTRLIQKSKEV
jgi:small subunit ribosomal protein S17